MATDGTALVTQHEPPPAALLEKVVIGGDLSKLSPADRLDYYRAVCASVGLNPLTRPFEYLVLSGKTVLYARKDATDQLRKIHNVSLEIVDREKMDDVYVVRARARMGERTDESIGAVSLGTLKGEALANALMKCESKAKRRVTLSICGLGLLDEIETESIPGAQRIELAEGVSAPERPRPPEPAKPRPPEPAPIEAAFGPNPKVVEWRKVREVLRVENLTEADALQALGVESLATYAREKNLNTTELVNQILDARDGTQPAEAIEGELVTTEARS